MKHRSANTWVGAAEGVLLFRPAPAEKLLKAIGWQKETKDNICEQTGLLIGYYEEHKNLPVVGVVTDILVSKTETSTPVYFEVSARENARQLMEFLKMQDELSKVDSEAAEKLRILGWWHTHPNSLPVFISNTDQGNIHRNFNRPDAFHLVLNPHRALVRCFMGENAVEVPVVLFRKNENAETIKGGISDDENRTDPRVSAENPNPDHPDAGVPAENPDPDYPDAGL